MQQEHINISPSRHNRWYEQILLNPLFGHFWALTAIILGAQFISYQAWPQNENQSITLGLLGLCYVIAVYLGKNITKFAGWIILNIWLLATKFQPCPAANAEIVTFLDSAHKRVERVLWS